MEPAGPARVERRLAAILAADVAGYSRLIEADEEGTLSRLKALRTEVIDPKIAGHLGRIVKTTGDGLLVEFASVVDALRCAAEMQTAIAKAMIRCRRTAASASASGSMLATSSSRTATSLAMESTSRLASKR
jgi:class 3 adenylate cyclase